MSSNTSLEVIGEKSKMIKLAFILQLHREYVHYDKEAQITKVYKVCLK